MFLIRNLFLGVGTIKIFNDNEFSFGQRVEISKRLARLCSKEKKLSLLVAALANHTEKMFGQILGFVSIILLLCMACDFALANNYIGFTMTIVLVNLFWISAQIYEAKYLKKILNADDNVGKDNE
jgi:hypothetical protein